MGLFRPSTPAEALKTAELAIVPVCDRNSIGTEILAHAAAAGISADEIRRACWTTHDSEKAPQIVRTPSGTADLVIVQIRLESSAFDLTAAAVRLATHAAATYESIAIVPLDGDRHEALLAAMLIGLAAGRHPLRPQLAADRSETAPILVALDDPLGTAMLARVNEHAEAAAWARDLVNAAPSAATPLAIAAQVVSEVAEISAVTTRVIGPEELTDAGFRAVAAVGRSSSQNPPCVIELHYKGAPNSPHHVALCGKGITYDGGGINVKPADVQRWMKADMAGGASVFAAFRGAARQQLAINIHAVVPLAENVYGERALRQGDVITHYNGLTTEVTHTDAEGRLVLSDCLAYLAETQPTVLIDVATLTNWILGPDLWMALGTDQPLIDDLLRAGEAVGEPGWQLPLWPGYSKCPTGSITDLQNYDFREFAPDTIVASHYLNRFTAAAPWAHLDIVGTAFRTERGNDGLLGATGSAARTLLHFLEQRAQDAASVA